MMTVDDVRRLDVALAAAGLSRKARRKAVDVMRGWLDTSAKQHKAKVDAMPAKELAEALRRTRALLTDAKETRT